MDELKLYSAASSHVGVVRSNNEDSYFHNEEKGFFAVADGMGGAAGGEIASRLTMEALQRASSKIPDELFLRDGSIEGRQQIFDWLTATIEGINDTLQQKAKEMPRLRGMGCTLDIALFRGNSVFIAHIGDSRIYLMRQEQLYQLTEDHSLGQMMITSGALTPEQAAQHPQRNVLLRVLGPMPKIEIDLLYYELAPGDIFLLCSDGVHGEIDPERIRKALSFGPERGSKEIVQASIDAGGSDNITAIVVAVEPRPDFRPAVIGSEQARQAMLQSSLFSTLTLHELLRVQKIATALHFEPGEFLFQQGDLCDFILLNIGGQHSVWRDGVQLGGGSVGDPLGEIALTPAISFSTVRADSAVVVLRFPLSELKKLLNNDISIAAKISTAALERLSIRFRSVVESLAKYRKAYGPTPPSV